MKRTIIVMSLFACLCSPKPVYATFDVVGKIEDILEQAEDYKAQIEEMQNKIADIQKRVTQGFNEVGKCLSNPTGCDVSKLSSLASGGLSAVKNAQSFVMAMNGSGLEKGDLGQSGDKDYASKVKKAYIFNRGDKKDMEKLNQNRQGINLIVISDTNALFAKGITTHHSIMTENDIDSEDSIYQKDFGQSANIEDVLRAQLIVALYTQYRLARILELRSNMVGAESTLELVQQNMEVTENETEEE